MLRILLMPTIVIGIGVFALDSRASEAECWQQIKISNQGTEELSKLTERHRQLKTEDARCAMLAKVRETMLQKIEMSKACAPYVATAQADITKAKETLKQLQSPQLRCPSAVSKPASAEERCHDDLSRSRAKSDEAIRTSRAWAQSNSDTDFCAMIPAAKQLIAAGRKAIASCQHIYPEKMAEERMSAERYEKSIAVHRTEYARRCTSRPSKRI